MPAIAPLLADIDGLIAVAVAVISIVGFISNLISGQQKGQKNVPAPRPKRAPDRRIRDEIEAFLQEATGNKGQRADRPAPPARQEPQRKGGQKSRPKPPPQRKTPAAPAAERPDTSDKLGRDIQTHVQQHMSDRVGQQVSRDLAPHIAPPHLGLLGGGDKTPANASVASTASQGSTTAAELLALLRSPQGRKQAMVMAEILQKPLSLRR